MPAPDNYAHATEFSMKQVLAWNKVVYFYLKLFDIETYSQVSSIRRTIVGNKIVDHSDVVGASPVGAAPTTSSFST